MGCSLSTDEDLGSIFSIHMKRRKEGKEERSGEGGKDGGKEREKWEGKERTVINRQGKGVHPRKGVGTDLSRESHCWDCKGFVLFCFCLFGFLTEKCNKEDSG